MEKEATMARRIHSGTAHPAGPESLAFGGAGFVEAAVKASMAGLQSAGRVQAEALRFVTERLAKDFEMPARLVACRDFDGVVEEQQKFATTLMKDYSEEGRRVLDLLAEGTRGDVGGKSSSES
jgi:hypothetical protein